MRQLTKTLALVGASAYMIAIAVTMMDIVLRIIGTGAIQGVTDLTELCVITGAMLAIPYGFMSDQHVAIDLFTNKFPEGVQVALRIVAALLAMALLSGVLWFSFQQALSDHASGDRSQTIGIPMMWYWAPFLLGTALAILATLVQAVVLIRDRTIHQYDSNEVTL